jgi:hypothetical protein
MTFSEPQLFAIALLCLASFSTRTFSDAVVPQTKEN